MWSSNKDGLTADAVHVDAGACLQVIQVNVAIFGNKENHILLGAYLSKNKDDILFVNMIMVKKNKIERPYINQYILSIQSAQ